MIHDISNYIGIVLARYLNAVMLQKHFSKVINILGIKTKHNAISALQQNHKMGAWI
jgi:hypothetical protein